MSRYDDAVHEVESVLDEWLAGYGDRILVLPLSKAIVERLVSKGAIQSTDSDELTDYWATHSRTGPLQPGRTVVGGPTEAELAEAREWRRVNFPGISDEP